MSTNMLIAVIVAAVVVVAVLATILWFLARRRHLRDRFGPEYERTVEEKGGTMAAERELRAREQRHDQLDIKELPADRQRQYTEDWSGLQEHFVDRPADAVDKADDLVSRLMTERGYPTEGYRGAVRDLSVEHSRTLEHYRAAHDVRARSAKGQATTEELRGAMVHYRALFEELLTDQRSR
ncbi:MULTISPECIES: hypothetical protein [unclassified Streptomyces]|uniref:hypothetical protein n=1 Tax=unclassified Streptomyces TaxID=2593676 RepID=UPI00224F02AC|nr:MULTISPECIES: hypothetical protein [unclassified Streptomyces]MCX5152152.1 hypothetical protein [Streptomyces sp. NBC_00320]WSN53139.1 hypothetical protein OG299_38395 [Streptomyces sp. NBC_01296]WSW57351.1 hypothetical protein OG513_01510 [Streptomyces sp. NBC_00998]